MAATFVLIGSATVSSSVTEVTFSSIPSTYNDLQIYVSARNTASAIVQDLNLSFNGTGTPNTSSYVLFNPGNSAVTGIFVSNIWAGEMTGNSATATSFSNGSVYIPRYKFAEGQRVEDFSTSSNAASAAIGYTIGSAYWNVSSAISNIRIQSTAGTTMSNNSTFYLYGIKNT
jgi:hypothetical protein